MYEPSSSATERTRERERRPAAPATLSSSPDVLIRGVAELLGLSHRVQVLDLTCAHGTLALAFAPFAGHVTALVASAAEAARLARRASEARARVRTVEGTVATLPAALGRYRLATWQGAGAQALKDALPHLEAHVDRGGALALFRTRRLAASATRRERLLSPDAEERDGVEAVLLGSPLDDLTRSAVVLRRRTPLVTILAPEAHDARDELRRALAAHADADGSLEEVVEVEALLARRTSDLGQRRRSERAGACSCPLR